MGVPSELLICGGVARNVGIARAIEARLGRPVPLPDVKVGHVKNDFRSQVQPHPAPAVRLLRRQCITHIASLTRHIPP